MTVRIIVGDALTELRKLPEGSVHMCVTSPPYLGLRSYGTPPQVFGGDPECEHDWQDSSWRADRWGAHDDETPGDKQRTNGGSLGHRGGVHKQDACRCGAWRGDLGLEPTMALYLDHMVEIFREVRRVLRSDGTFWLNIGDSYNNAYNGGAGPGSKLSQTASRQRPQLATGYGLQIKTLKPKDLMMIPARLAIRLCDDGWYLRSEITWAKKAPMPESVTDRPTSATEKVFLLTKSPRYFYDAEAVKEIAVADHGSGNGYAREARLSYAGRGSAEPWIGPNRKAIRAATESRHRSLIPGGQSLEAEPDGTRNMRNWWLLGPEPFSGWGFDFAAADYVDDRGVPRKRSPDCPVHGPGGSLQPEIPEAAAGDVQPDDRLPRTPRIDGRRGQEQVADSVPIGHCTLSPRPDNQSVSRQESTRESRTDEGRSGGLPQTQSRTGGTPQCEGDVLPGSDPRSCSQIASDRNTQSRRTGRALSAEPRDTVSAEPPCHRPHSEPGFFEKAPHASTPENNSGVHLSSLPFGETDTQKRPSRSGIQSQIASHTSAKCSCQESRLSHFATFPSEVPRRAILAGTSEKGVCPMCGAPWVRQIERSKVEPVDYEGKWLAAEPQSASRRMLANVRARREAGEAHDNPFPAATTTGWSPSCGCPAAAPIPATVLDCFSGAGTTALVADRLGRDAIGIELNPEYARMSERRLRADAGMFAQIAAD